MNIYSGHAGDDLDAAPRLSVIRLSDVQPERVRWLWPGRIPAGKLVTLDGDPGLGKSTLALEFAATITTGGTWPDRSVCAFPGAVILLSAEDGLADTVRPRLDAASADATRVHAVQGVTMADGSLRPPTLADVNELTELVTETSARLLVIDVLMAYLPSGTDSHKDQDIRRVLSRLSAMADATGCTILLLRHLNKAKGGDPMYRGGGSIGIVGAARAGMLVARDPDDDNVRVLASTKSNLGPEPEALRYQLVDADSHGVAQVQWLGISTHNARALLADHGDGEDRPERDGAAAWLTDYLTEHTKAPSKDVKVAARKEQISGRCNGRPSRSGWSTSRRAFPGAPTGACLTVTPLLAPPTPVTQTVARLAPLARLGLTCTNAAPMTPPNHSRASRATVLRPGVTAPSAGTSCGQTSPEIAGSAPDA